VHGGADHDSSHSRARVVEQFDSQRSTSERSDGGKRSYFARSADGSSSSDCNRSRSRRASRSASETAGRSRGDRPGATFDGAIATLGLESAGAGAELIRFASWFGVAWGEDSWGEAARRSGLRDDPDDDLDAATMGDVGRPGTRSDGETTPGTDGMAIAV
jgi:hypothetical protein